MQVLDGKMPYVLAVGNHDIDKIVGKRSAVLFGRHFSAERFSKLPLPPAKYFGRHDILAS